MHDRSMTRRIMVGDVAVGGGASVSIQSMTNTATVDVAATTRQIRRLHRAGCEIVRVAVPDEAAAAVLGAIVKVSPMPVIADIHFSAALAVEALRQGVHGIRINPGNIKNKTHLKEIIASARAAGAAIRIGVNSGSLDADLRRKFGSHNPEALVESAMRYIDFFESCGFTQMKVSLKSSDVLTTVAAYRRFAGLSDYPLHLGITEAGTVFGGTIRSSVGIGHMLLSGIGDTLRVSLTADPVKEIDVAREMLKACGLRGEGPTLVSCPTCARREIDVIRIARIVEKEIRRMTAPITVAVMGCPVNGPGEAMDADIGLAGGREGGVIFRKGRVVARIDNPDDMLRRFLDELRSFRS